MAEQHWIKYYRINPKHIKDDGTIDDDTPLYPYFANFLDSKYNSLDEKDLKEKFNKSISYDDDSTVKTDGGEFEHVYDMRNNKKHDTGLKRGFSVNGYVRGADGLLWSPKGDDSGSLVVYPSRLGFDDIVEYDIPNDFSTSIIPNREYAEHLADNEHTRDLLLPFETGKFSKDQDNLITLPTIVTADKDALVNYSDFIHGGYNTTGDTLHEKLLKNIKYRRLPIGFRYKRIDNDKYINVLETAKNLVKDITDAAKNRDSNKLINIYERENTNNSIIDYDSLYKYTLHKTGKKDLYSCIVDMFRTLEKVKNSNIDDSLFDSIITKAKTVLGGINAFMTNNPIFERPLPSEQYNWFPKNIISSDERLKDIEGSADSNWIDFGDSHKKHIYDDFMKWYDNSCTQRDIANCLGDRL